MNIGFEAKRVFHNHSGLGNYARTLVSTLANHAPQHTYRLYNPSDGKIIFNPQKVNLIEVRPAIKHKLFSHLWRQKLVSIQAAREGVEVFHGLSQELPANLRRNGIKSVVSIHDLIFIIALDQISTSKYNKV